MSTSRRLVVIGAGGHGKVVASAAREARWWVLAVLDDDKSLKGHHVLGVEIAGGIDLLGHLEHDAVVIGVGNNRVRASIAGRLDGEWAAIVHPSAVVHPSVEVGPGSVVFAGAVIQPDTVIGAHVIVNTGAVIDHDCRIGDFAHVAPRAALAGNVTVGEGTFVGIGAAIVPGITIGRWATIGAGAAVVRDVPNGETVAGVPARVLKRD